MMGQAQKMNRGMRLPGGGPNRRRTARPGRGRRGRMGRAMGSKAMYSAGGLAGAMQVASPN